MLRDADHSGGVTLSSIALLQERFRQLQKMKELRQKRELMRALSESERCTPPPPPPVGRPTPPPAQLVLSLWPDSQAKRAETKVEAPLYHLLPPISPQFNFEISDSNVDIDTSLRL